MQRKKALETAHPRDLVIDVTILSSDCVALESFMQNEIRRALEGSNVNREWFRLPMMFFKSELFKTIIAKAKVLGLVDSYTVNERE